MYAHGNCVAVVECVPQATKANVLRITYRFLRTKNTGSCTVNISSRVAYATATTVDHTDHFSGTRFVAVPLPVGKPAQRSVRIEVIGRCVLEINLVTAERIEASMPGLYPEVTRNSIPFPEGGACNQDGMLSPPLSPLCNSFLLCGLPWLRHFFCVFIFWCCKAVASLGWLHCRPGGLALNPRSDTPMIPPKTMLI